MSATIERLASGTNELLASAANKCVHHRREALAESLRLTLSYMRIHHTKLSADEIERLRRDVLRLTEQIVLTLRVAS